MSNLGLSMQDSRTGKRPPKRPRRKRSGVAVFVAVIVVVGIVGAALFGGNLIYQKMQTSGPPEDYRGPGSGEVVVYVTQGQTLTDIGASLRQADVVASVQAFADAAMLEGSRAESITPGAYVMLKQMSGQQAVERLLDPTARNDNSVTITEGLRSYEVAAKLSEASGIPKEEFERVLASPTALKLPPWAKGTGAARAEGFLFPATYDFEKSATAQQMLQTMVDKFNAVAASMKFFPRAKATGRTPYDVLIIASLIQGEGHPRDFKKVSRVVYNILNPSTWGGTYGYLGFDSTLNYVLQQSEINISQEDLETNSPYNTRSEHHQGLPPTPINNPGQDALEAALEPAKGAWLWFVTTNPDTGETKFTDNYNEFLGFKSEFEEWYAQNQQ